ncbi:NADP-dependent oxidoreductase [Streptomyces sp. GZWMJZ-114]|uniref:NADP-dependent oxidoreductase n=1 Tax=Streptomyces sp. GZWMJZ-114 TaxID=2494734 RepID=UPI0010109E21|nr:NADP-dependent oxidoreductase [Streptomyces sp. GZWMJZ-114]
MRAVQIEKFGGPEELRFVETDTPEPGPGQVRIAVRACGTNPADWAVREGMLGGPLPQGTGFEVAGVVDALGAGAEGVSVGDRVFGNVRFGTRTSGAAEYTVLDHWSFVPESLSFAQAAAIPMAGETAVRALDEVGVTGGQTVFINGASGAVGQLATQVAVQRGARVIGTSGAAKAARMRELGAEVVAHGDGLEERVRELAPQGVDRVVDIGPGGQLPLLISLAGGDTSRVVTVTDFQNADTYGVRASGRENTVFRYDALQPLADDIAAGRISFPVWRVEPWEKVAEVQETIRSGGSEGKTVLRVSE